MSSNNIIQMVIRIVVFPQFQHSMWEFQDFPVIQILREINFRDFRSSKTAIFSFLGAPNIANLVIFSLQNSEPLNVFKWHLHI